MRGSAPGNTGSRRAGSALPRGQFRRGDHHVRRDVRPRPAAHRHRTDPGSQAWRATGHGQLDTGGWAGAQFALQARYRPPPTGLVPPAEWGTLDRLHELFGDRVVSLETSWQHADFTHHDTHQLFELFKASLGPVATLWDALVEMARAEFATAWISLAEQFNIADDGTCEIPSTYLQVIAVKV